MDAPQMVQLTDEQLQAFIAQMSDLQTSLETFGLALVIVTVIAAFFIGFEMAGFHFWKRIFRE